MEQIRRLMEDIANGQSSDSMALFRCDLILERDPGNASVRHARSALLKMRDYAREALLALEANSRPAD